MNEVEGKVEIKPEVVVGTVFWVRGYLIDVSEGGNQKAPQQQQPTFLRI